jgi:hypothetical protein
VLDVEPCARALVQVVGVRDDLIFGPRSGNGSAVITADGSVLWDDAAQGHDGQVVEALMHSASLARRYETAVSCRGAVHVPTAITVNDPRVCSPHSL